METDRYVRTYSYRGVSIRDRSFLGSWMTTRAVQMNYLDGPIEDKHFTLHGHTHTLEGNARVVKRQLEAHPG